MSGDAKADSEHFCYMLLSESKPNSTYIGYSTNPFRRLREHNGLVKNKGAKYTSTKGRPWRLAFVVSGFQTDVEALRFEWAWKNWFKSTTFTSAVTKLEPAAVASIKSKYGPKTRSAVVRLMVNSPPRFWTTGGHLELTAVPFGYGEVSTTDVRKKKSAKQQLKDMLRR